MTFLMLVLLAYLGSAHRYLGSALAQAETNLAVRKPTSASTRCDRCSLSDPAHVVDGSHSARFPEATCFNTEVRDLHPWWQVDLQHTYLITNVFIVSSDRYGETYYQGKHRTWAAESVATYKMTRIQCAVICGWTPRCSSFNTPLKDDGSYCEILHKVVGQKGKKLMGWKRIRLMP
ncbi:uncharacterized protein LOC124256863 [Haliotis rubra]|uniref:uncharacterized protein LOC124256863 n=1 Tax=Haliotis rubra TaxID=36100 RepID=UPI001EE54B0C|nr:uncharacterized protein LOC124256863 [Haliotis rubra]